jgi:regulatory protein
VSTRLRQAGFSGSAVTTVVNRLIELAYLDDMAFAQAWANERGTGIKASGRRRLAWELAQKGIAREIVDEVLSQYGSEYEEQAARQVCTSLAAKMAREQPDQLRRHLYQALARRGFDREAINRALAESLGRGEIE